MLFNVIFKMTHAASLSGLPESRKVDTALVWSRLLFLWKVSKLFDDNGLLWGRVCCFKLEIVVQAKNRSIKKPLQWSGLVVSQFFMIFEIHYSSNWKLSVLFPITSFTGLETYTSLRDVFIYLSTLASQFSNHFS